MHVSVTIISLAEDDFILGYKSNMVLCVLIMMLFVCVTN